MNFFGWLGRKETNLGLGYGWSISKFMVLGREVTITWGVGCVASKEKEVLPLRVVRTVGRVAKGHLLMNIIKLIN